LSVALKSVLLKRYEKLSTHCETLQKHSSKFWNIRCVSRIRVETFKCVEDHYQSVAMHSQRVENSLKRISTQFSFSLVFPDRVTNKVQQQCREKHNLFRPFKLLQKKHSAKQQ